MLDDLVGCWSRAGGQDLAGWAEQWLRAEGATAIVLDAEGAVVQDVPRWQRIGIGLYDLGGDGQLRRRCLVHAELAAGFAASAQAGDQLAVIGAWLAGQDLPDGLALDAGLRARILFTLAARGLARREDIDALPRLDPVTGEVNRATCLAMQPDLAAKEAAWTVALPPASRPGSRRPAPPASGCRDRRS